MRRITADFIYPVTSKPLKNGIIVVDDDGTVLELIDTKGNFREMANTEYYNGILVPGFINCHCHLELSHLKGMIQQGLGLTSFVGAIPKIRITSEEVMLASAIAADRAMYNAGIKVVGDISNKPLTFPLKKKSLIRYYTFIELLGVVDSKAEDIMHQGMDDLQLLKNMGLPGSIVPHAAYSVSLPLYTIIRDSSMAENVIFSVHNQECAAEDSMFRDKAGNIFEFASKMGLNIQEFQATGKSALLSRLDYMPTNNNILLIHNTYSSSEDVQAAMSRLHNPYWVLCPGSNKYIEGRLPDIMMLKRNGAVIALGTDSLASNTILSVLEEMKIIVKDFPEISFDEVLCWATINGAKALGFEEELGSFDLGKKPGINLIGNFDYKTNNITASSVVRVLK